MGGNNEEIQNNNRSHQSSPPSKDTPNYAYVFKHKWVYKLRAIL